MKSEFYFETMDSDINDLVQKMDFASIPEQKEPNNSEISRNRRSSRLRHGSTSQGNVDSDSDSTIDPNQLVIQNDKSETGESLRIWKIKNLYR